jgi:hypothetical protein
MTPQEAEIATPEALKAAHIETGKAMIAAGQTPADVAAWLTVQNPAAFPDVATAGAALA